MIDRPYRLTESDYFFTKKSRMIKQLENEIKVFVATSDAVQQILDEVE